MKVVIDMNLTPAWVEFMAANGLEAQHWSAVGSRALLMTPSCLGRARMATWSSHTISILGHCSPSLD